MTAGPLGAVARLPSAPGVYRFRDARQRVLYIGRAADLRRRVASYWGDLGDRPHLSRMVPRIARIEAVVCDSEHEAAWLERNLLETRLPSWNRTPGGQEVPVYLRLDQQSRSARLTIVHYRQFSDSARYFGPYLGGLKVRLAVSALHRILPLAFTADRLSGSERDMARVRGVDAGDRDALIQAVTAVLDREPTALTSLRTELTRRRDSAALGLAFELAARLQAEIEAVEWVVAEQKVASLEPDDFDVHGWAEGVLVRFEVRRGNLRAWSQRTCGEAAAAPRLAANPPLWTDFAQRNAQLAALLSR
jgi:excinuclease ABC subunit C